MDKAILLKFVKGNKYSIHGNSDIHDAIVSEELGLLCFILHPFIFLTRSLGGAFVDY